MSSSGSRWLDLRVALEDPSDELSTAVEEFEPLPFPAGRAAAEWLRSALDGLPEGVQGWLALAANAPRLCGFFVLRPMSFNITKSRLVLLQVRKHRLEPGPQAGMQLDWIARHKLTAPGYGGQLVAFALADAQARAAKALIVEPDDDVTRAMWQREHRFVPFEARPEEGDEHAEWLWLPTGEPPRGWPS